MKIWIQTLLGGFDLLEPRVEHVDFQSLSVALSRIPRFLGYTSGGVLSVAQHCVEGAWAIERETRRRDAAAAFLLHDAHEAFVADIPTPVQRALEAYSSDAGVVRVAFRALKDQIDAAIYDAAGFEWPLDDETRDIVRVFDLRMCRTERDLFCPPPWQRWEDAIENAIPVDGCSREMWGSKRAQWEFQCAFTNYFAVEVC